MSCKVCGSRRHDFPDTNSKEACELNKEFNDLKTLYIALQKTVLAAMKSGKVCDLHPVDGLPNETGTVEGCAGCFMTVGDIKVEISKRPTARVEILTEQEAWTRLSNVLGAKEADRLMALRSKAPNDGSISAETRVERAEIIRLARVAVKAFNNAGAKSNSNVYKTMRTLEQAIGALDSEMERMAAEDKERNDG